MSEHDSDITPEAGVEDAGAGRSRHPQFVAKRPVRVKVGLTNGRYLLGDCHVVASDGRVSDVVNDDRPFLILTRVTLEGDRLDYDVVTVNKDSIEMVFEIRRGG